MRVLVTGRGTSGSWAVRGLQLGAAIGADVIPRAFGIDGYDLAIIVKRPYGNQAEAFRAAGVPVVYDIVDSWPQPGGNSWPKDECLNWLGKQIALVRPDAIVAATKAMAQDCEEFGIPVIALPHHARPGQQTNCVNGHVQYVGYEGAEHYLGKWRQILERECAQRGWGFKVNPSALCDLDIVVALRDFDGYASRHWKSNVKLANAQGSGTPCILTPECGYLENSSRGAECWADTEAELSAALDYLTPWHIRHELSKRLIEHAPRLEQIAQTYKAWLASLLKS